MDKRSKRAWKELIIEYGSVELVSAIKALKKISKGDFNTFPSMKRAALVREYLAAQHIPNHPYYNTGGHHE